MPLDEARRIIREPTSTPFQIARAAVAINRFPESSFDDLLACLHRRGYSAEVGALGLYSRTGRVQASTHIKDLITDYDDWYAYLKERNHVVS